MSAEAINKEEIGPGEERLNDLPVTNDQAEETKGGEEWTLNYAKIEYRSLPPSRG